MLSIFLYILNNILKIIIIIYSKDYIKKITKTLANIKSYIILRYNKNHLKNIYLN